MEFPWRSAFQTVVRFFYLVLCSRFAGYLSIKTVLKYQSGNERTEPNSEGMVTTVSSRV